MLSLDILSDLHLDLLEPNEINQFFEDLTLHSKADIALIPGDLAQANDSRYGNWLERLTYEYRSIYLNAGNHEFWHSSLPKTNKRLRSLCNKHYINFVEPGKVFQIGEYKIMGGTLWYNDPMQYPWWIDHRQIECGAYDIAQAHQEFIDKVLPAIDSKTIVMSHHFPTSEFIDPLYAGMETNIYFCAYLDNKIIQSPCLWTFGHTHMPMDAHSQLGFRGYCNPLGYNREGFNPRFWDRLTIEIP
jgi:predicted phosphohydrolase